jgi:hypothetical protein
VDRSCKYTIEPFTNGLSDHDAQLLKIYNQPPALNNMKSIPIRTMDEQSIKKFLLLLSEEPWEEIFRDNSNDPDNMFKKFLNTYIRYYDDCFVKKFVNLKHKYCTMHGSLRVSLHLVKGKKNYSHKQELVTTIIQQHITKNTVLY